MYTQQPSSGLTCTPGADQPALYLVCEVEQHSANSGQGFAVLWFEVLQGSTDPALLPEHYVTEQYRSNAVMSNLTVDLPLKEELDRLFCQIRLDDGTLLQQSQPLVVVPPTSAVPCGPHSLVDTTRVCGDTSPLAQEQVATTSTPPANPMLLSVVFYAVVAIIVLFVLIIIVLTIIVMFLYQRKCGRNAVTRSTGKHIHIKCIADYCIPVVQILVERLVLTVVRT